MVNRNKHIASRQEKIDWLLNNQHLWEGWTYAVAGHDTRKKPIVQAMKRAGLISKATYWPDVSLDNLIRDARKQRRHELHNQSGKK